MSEEKINGLHPAVFYAIALKKDLLKQKMNDGQIRCAIDEYKALYDKTQNAESAFRGVYAKWGSRDVAFAMVTIKDVIKTALEKASQTHKGIDSNSITRLQDLIQRFNENLDKCAVEVDGKPIDKAFLEQIKMRSPLIRNATKLDYVAYASSPAKRVTALEVEIKFP